MKQEFIERLEKQRYNAILWQTISFAVWFGVMLILPYLPTKPLAYAGFAVIVVGAAVFFFFTFRLTRLTRQIVSDPEIRSAVNNELFLANDRRAASWGYFITIFAVVVMFIISHFTAITAQVATGVVLIAGVVGAKISQLVLHRE